MELATRGNALRAVANAPNAANAPVQTNRGGPAFINRLVELFDRTATISLLLLVLFLLSVVFFIGLSFFKEKDAKAGKKTGAVFIMILSCIFALICSIFIWKASGLA
jgi:hypothetical protein